MDYEQVINVLSMEKSMCEEELRATKSKLKLYDRLFFIMLGSFSVVCVGFGMLIVLMYDLFAQMVRYLLKMQVAKQMQDVNACCSSLQQSKYLVSNLQMQDANARCKCKLQMQAANATVLWEKTQAGTQLDFQYFRYYESIPRRSDSKLHSSQDDQPKPNCTNTVKGDYKLKWRFSETVNKETTMAEPNDYITAIRKNFVSNDNEGRMVEKCIVEIQGTFLVKIRDYSFNGNIGENAFKHIKFFLEVVGPIKINGLTQDRFRLSVFPVSLAGTTSEWFTKECIGSITTWDNMVEKFILKFHHLSNHDEEEEIEEDDNPN
ncbi:hypothetical protein Tco_1066514 [Tanacetum coccineum]|uniref:Uncharacterized protein n=1 Tax=Tanacetum coccineum TaxID=301880 RepID=A0ABQ5HA88_9ASTR